MVIFDKSNQSNMLYTNPKYDISDRLIKKLGYVPGETVEPEGGKDDGKGDSLMDRGRDAVNGAKDSARDKINGATGGRGGSGGRGTMSRPSSKN